ncbi:MAG: small multi-drug export protein [Thermoplasmata archaeon]|nr:small multi-drug export protein [Thermoplasmata archaeon]
MKRIFIPAASGISKWIVGLLCFFPPLFLILSISMIPLVELRGTILLWGAGFPFEGFPYPDGWLKIYVVSVIGNMIPIPLLLLFFPWVEKKLRRWGTFERFFDRLFARTKSKASRSVEKYEELALLLFVALPLPVTGAWTGSLVAYLFGLDRSKSLIFIFLGVLTAGAIMLVLVLISPWVALVIIAGLTVMLVALGRGGEGGKKRRVRRKRKTGREGKRRREMPSRR